MLKALETKTFMLLYLDFASNIVLSCFFFFFLIVDLYFLIHVVITQTFNPSAELLILIGIPTKEAKAEMGTYLVIAGIKTSMCSR